MTDPLNPAKRWTRRLIEATIGGAVGAGAGFGVAKFVMSTDARSWDAAELASLVIALLLTLIGGFTAFMAANTDRYRRLVAYRQPDAEVPDEDSTRAVRDQSLLLMLTGPLLAAPVVLAQLGLDGSARAAGAMAILLVLALQSWMNWRAWRAGDELMRQVALTSGAWCFWGLQLILFVWATLAKLGLVADVDSWTMLTVLMATYLTVSTFVGFRRGLGQL